MSLAKPFGEKGKDQVAPLLVSGYGNLTDVFIMVDQESDVAPVALFRPAPKIFKDEQRADFFPAPDRFERGGLYLADFSFAELAADLGADDRAGRIDDGEWHRVATNLFIGLKARRFSWALAIPNYFVVLSSMFSPSRERLNLRPATSETRLTTTPFLFLIVALVPAPLLVFSASTRW